jgi:hypothetical protein
MTAHPTNIHYPPKSRRQDVRQFHRRKGNSTPTPTRAMPLPPSAPARQLPIHHQQLPPQPPAWRLPRCGQGQYRSTPDQPRAGRNLTADRSQSGPHPIPPTPTERMPARLHHPVPKHQTRALPTTAHPHRPPSPRLWQLSSTAGHPSPVPHPPAPTPHQQPHPVHRPPDRLKTHPAPGRPPQRTHLSTAPSATPTSPTTNAPYPPSPDGHGHGHGHAPLSWARLLPVA